MKQTFQMARQSLFQVKREILKKGKEENPIYIHRLAVLFKQYRRFFLFQSFLFFSIPTLVLLWEKHIHSSTKNVLWQEEKQFFLFYGIVFLGFLILLFKQKNNFSFLPRIVMEKKKAHRLDSRGAQEWVVQFPAFRVYFLLTESFLFANLYHVGQKVNYWSFPAPIFWIGLILSISLFGRMLFFYQEKERNRRFGICFQHQQDPLHPTSVISEAIAMSQKQMQEEEQDEQTKEKTAQNESLLPFTVLLSHWEEERGKSNSLSSTNATHTMNPTSTEMHSMSISPDSAKSVESGESTASSFFSTISEKAEIDENIEEFKITPSGASHSSARAGDFTSVEKTQEHRKAQEGSAEFELLWEKDEEPQNKKEQKKS